MEKLFKLGLVSPIKDEQPYPTRPSQIDSQQAPSTMQPAEPVKTGLVQLDQTALEKFGEWLKEDWLLKLGAVLLLIGFGWLATYAFLKNWIGPMGRIALGIIGGSLILLFGWWRIKKYIHQGSIFLVLGSTVILLTIFAAREIYNFFEPASALGVMFLSIVFVALASVKYHSRSLALTSLVLAGIAPLLTNGSSANYVGLFSYLLVVVLGTLWIVALTGYREVITAALILIVFYSLPHLFSVVPADKGVLLLFAYAFVTVFFIANAVGFLKLKGKEIMPDLLTAGGNGMFLLFWIMVAATNEWKSLILSAWMIVFALGAFLIFKATQRREPFFVYAGVGVAMLAAATSTELQGAVLAIAYTLESGIIALIVYSIIQDVRIAERTSLLLIVPIFLSFKSIASSAWHKSALNKDFFVLLILGLTLFGLGTFFWKRVKEIKNEEASILNSALLALGSIYIYILFWLSLHAAISNDDVATMISLVVYTIIGLIAYFYGRANEMKGIQSYGGFLLGFVVVRLLLVDVWQMELTGRIITFFLIGALLVSTAFLGRKKTDSAPA